MRDQSFEHPDGRMERRPNGAVLHLAVPPAVLELFADLPGDDIVDVLLEVDAQRDGHPVDARLDLAAEERLTSMFPPAVLPDLRHRSAYLLIAGIDTAILQEHEAVSSRGPGLALGALSGIGARPSRRE